MTPTALFTAILVLATVPLAAQRRERDDVQLRNDCRLATQILTTGQPAPRRGWALETIGRCDESGPEALVTAWGVDLDSAAVAELAGASLGLRDQRLLQAVITVAQNTSRPTEVRLAALSVLGSYARPEYYFSRALLRAPDTIRTPFGHVDYSPTEGAQPLIGPRAAVLATLTGLAGDPDPAVQRAAAYMSAWLGNP